MVKNRGKGAGTYTDTLSGTRMMTLGFQRKYSWEEEKEVLGMMVVIREAGGM